MRMSDFVVREAIVPDLKATTKEAVIREMVESLRAAGYFKGGELEDIVKAILKREALGSTGIGRSVAIPHSGVQFDSLDGEPVHVFVLLISPQDRPGDHLRALENVSRSLRDDNFVRALRAATTREGVWGLLDGADRPAT